MGIGKNRGGWSLLLGVLLGEFLWGTGLEPPLVHQPPASFESGQPIVLRVTTAQKPEWLNVFWRPVGAGDFTARLFRATGDGGYEVRIEAEEITAPQIEYYLAIKVAGRITFLPERVPDELFRVAISGSLTGPGQAEVAGEAAPVSPAGPFPVKLDASVEHRFQETSEAELPRDPGHTENLRLEYHQQVGAVALDLRSRATCSNQLAMERTKVDLPDLMVSLTTGAHALRLGDIAPVESELTIGGGGRRGLEYLFDNQRLYFHLFTGSTQQLSGFKGFGIPKAAAGIFGGAAGFTLFHRFGLKAIFVTGQDDPTLAANIGTADILSQPRKGNVLAVTGKTTLWQDRLSLTMEYAQSRFDPDTTDGSGEIKDAALQISSTLRLGILDLQAGYRDIGRNFQPIAQSIFVNDRRGASAAAGVTLGKVRWSGTLAIEKTNTDDDPTLIAAKDLRRQVDFSWQFGSMSSFRLGYSASRQDARLNDDPVMQGNMNQEGLTAGLGLGFSQALQLNLDARFDRLKNADDPSLEGDSLSLNLGLLWQSPDRFLWSSTLGLTQTKNRASGERGKLITVSCTGNFTLVARLLSLNATGAYFRSDLAGPNDSDTLSVDGGISLNLRRLVRIGDVIVSLRGGLNSTTTAGQKVHDSRLFLRGDVSL